MSIPKDPHILLSYINTKLRDDYRSLDDLCKSLDVDRQELEIALSKIQYSYRKEQNRFVINL